MFGILVYFLLSALQAHRIIAEVPASCQKNSGGFFVTEDTYVNKIVAFQVASAPSSFNITDHYLTLDNPTGYLNIRNITVHPSISYAVGFLPIYQRASQSPKSGAWSCAWHKFVEAHTVYNYTQFGSDTDLELIKLNWDPSPLLFTSNKALNTDFREDWTSMSFGWIVRKNVEGDTRVMGSMARGTFFAYRGDNGKTLVGHADMAKLDDEQGQPIELRMIIVGDKAPA